MSAVEVIGASKIFNQGKAQQVDALVDVNLTVNQGEFVSLIGPSGCGKSTLLRLIANLLEPTSGSLMVNNKTVSQARLDQDYGMAFQQAGLFDWRTVSKNIELPLELKGWDKEKRAARAAEMLELVKLPEFANLYPWQLSGGMQQRIAIARALAAHPPLLLMDEPSSGLDPRARIEMRELLKELRRMGKTILISSHILFELAELCTAVGVVEQGKLIFSGGISEMMDRAGSGSMVHVVVDERPQEAAALLKQVRGILKVTLEREEKVVRIDVTIDPKSGMPISDIPSRLIAQGFRVARFSHEPMNLETAFMRLTKGIVS